MIKRVMIHVEISEGRIHPVCLELLAKTNALFEGDNIKVADRKSVV